MLQRVLALPATVLIFEVILAASEETSEVIGDEAEVVDGVMTVEIEVAKLRENTEIGGMIEVHHRHFATDGINGVVKRTEEVVEHRHHQEEAVHQITTHGTIENHLQSI